MVGFLVSAETGCDRKKKNLKTVQIVISGLRGSRTEQRPREVADSALVLIQSPVPPVPAHRASPDTTSRPLWAQTLPSTEWHMSRGAELWKSHAGEDVTLHLTGSWQSRNISNYRLP